MSESSLNAYSHEYFMKKALEEANIAFEKGEIPVGCIVVSNNKIISRSHNMTETLNDVTAHAEMQAVTAAANTIGGKYLNQCTLYVTLEPCTMCAGALGWAQVDTLVYGASDKKKGFRTHTKMILHPNTKVIDGIMHEECSELLKLFFRTKRN